MIPAHQHRPRGPLNELHRAAFQGSAGRTIAVLSRGAINIDQGSSTGMTPLLFAAQQGHSRVAAALLDRGANVSITDEGGFSALHISAQNGHLAVTLQVVRAGADLEARTSYGATALDLTAQQGHSEVVSALIEAGAKVDCRASSGETPIFAAAKMGHLSTVRELLRAGASTLLPAPTSWGTTYLPLDLAAQDGYTCMVREMIRQRGVEGCVGADGGAQALLMAAQNGHVETMAILADAGVVDTGTALLVAAARADLAAVRLLLQQRKLQGPSTDVVGYINMRQSNGHTPLFCSIDAVPDADGVHQPISPRVARMLIDAGADTTSALRVTNVGGDIFFCGTPLAYACKCLREKEVGGKDATEKELRRLETARRLLLRVEAVRAASWLWRADDSIAQLGGHGAGKASATSTPLRVMLPMLRRRARRRGLVMAPLFRLVVMACWFFSTYIPLV